MESSGSESIINGLLNWKGSVVTFCLTCWRTSTLKLQWKYLDSDTKLFLCQTKCIDWQLFWKSIHIGYIIVNFFNIQLSLSLQKSHNTKNLELNMITAIATADIAFMTWTSHTLFLYNAFLPLYLCTSIICVSFIYQANAIGRSAKTVREFLEKHYTEEVADSDDETIKLAIKALLEVCKFLWFMIFY